MPCCAEERLQFREGLLQYQGTGLCSKHEAAAEGWSLHHAGSLLPHPFLAVHHLDGPADCDAAMPRQHCHWGLCSGTDGPGTVWAPSSPFHAHPCLSMFMHVSPSPSLRSMLPLRAQIVVFCPTETAQWQCNAIVAVGVTVMITFAFDLMSWWPTETHTGSQTDFCSSTALTWSHADGTVHAFSICSLH